MAKTPYNSSWHKRVRMYRALCFTLWAILIVAFLLMTATLVQANTTNVPMIGKPDQSKAQAKNKTSTLVTHLQDMRGALGLPKLQRTFTLDLLASGALIDGKVMPGPAFKDMLRVSGYDQNFYGLLRLSKKSAGNNDYVSEFLQNKMFITAMQMTKLTHFGLAETKEFVILVLTKKPKAKGRGI